MSPGESVEKYTRHIFKLLCAIMDKMRGGIINTKLVDLYSIVIHLYPFY